MLRILLIAGLYFFAAQLGFEIAHMYRNPAPLWPAAGFGIALLAVFGYGYWPAILAASITSNFIYGHLAGPSVTIALGNTLESVAGCLVLNNVFRRNRSIEDQRELVAYVIAALVPTTFSASVGALSLWWENFIPTASILTAWSDWWIGNIISIPIITPFVLVLFEKKSYAEWNLARLKKFLFLTAALSIFTAVLFKTQYNYSILILSYPLLLCAAYLGKLEVALATFLISFLSVWSTMRGHGPFNTGSLNEDIVGLQLFLASLSLTGIMLRSLRRNGGLKLPAIALLATWTMTAVVFFSFLKAESLQDQKHFANLTNEAIEKIKARAYGYEDALKSGGSYMLSSKFVSSEEWSSYVMTSQLSQLRPAIARTGIVIPVPRDQRSHLIAKYRRIHRGKHFRIHSLSREAVTVGSADTNSVQYIVAYAHPDAPDLLGVDIASNLELRQKANMARDMGEATLSSRINLGDMQRGQGVILFTPFYQLGKVTRTVSERREAFAGWAYGLFMTDSLFDGLFDPRSSELQISVFMGSKPSSESLLYSSHGFKDLNFASIMSKTFAHQDFTFGFHRSAMFISTRDTSGAWILACGSLVALLLAALVASLQSINQRAELIAQEKTALLLESDLKFRKLNQDLEERVAERTREIKNANKLLRQKEARFRQLADSMPQIVWTIGAKGETDYVNLQWWKYTGQDPLSANSFWLRDALHPDDEPEVISAWQHTIRAGKLFEAEFRIRRYDDTYRWHLGRLIPILDTRGNFMIGYGTATDIDDQKRMITELAKSEQRFKQLADSMPQIVWTAKPDGHFDYYNERWYEFTGFSKPSDGDQVWTSIMPEEDSTRCLAAWHESVKTGEPYEMEYRFWDRKTHKYLWYLGRALPLKNKKGEVTRWFGTCTNIDEKKQSEETLLRLAAIIESSEDAIIGEDLSGNITNWNHAAERIFGYEETQILQKSALTLFPREKVVEQMMILENVKDGKTIRHFETEQIRSDGQVIPISISVSPIRNQDGKVTGVAKIVRDVTDEKRISSALKSSEKQLSIVTNNIPGMICYIDRERRYRYVNKMCEQWLRLKQSQIIGRTMEEILGEGEYDKVEPYVDIVLSGRTASFEDSIYSQNGISAYLSTKYVPDINENGEVLGFVALVLDISEQKLAEEQRSLSAIRERSAIETSQLKSEFLANMSHEVRTPISGVIGMVNLLEQTPLTEEQREYVEAISQSGELLLNVVNDILDFSRVEAGKLQLESIEFDLGKTISFLKKTFVPVAEEKGIALKFSGLEKIENTKLIGDPNRFTQILVNLLSNAIKFTHVGSVNFALSGDTFYSDDAQKINLIIEISDTGIGMSPDQIGKLFSPFTQADGSTSRKYGGSGLGLSISKKLLDLMQGDIEVQSRVLIGSTFRIHVTLPLSNRHNESYRHAINQRAQIDLSTAYVLIAEDNPINQKIAQRTVQSMGAQCMVVANGREALRALEQFVFDVVLMDCQMPEMDGFETTKYIRSLENEKISSIPIIAITANAMSDDRQKCLEAGMNDYISKPIDPSALNHALSKWFATNTSLATPTTLSPARSPMVNSTPVPVFDEKSLSTLFSLESNSDEKEKIVTGLIHTFLDKLDSDIEDILLAAKAKNMGEVNLKTHTLKSTCAALGVMRLSKICFELEETSSPKNADVDLKDLLALLTEESEYAKLSLNAFLNRNSGLRDAESVTPT